MRSFIKNIFIALATLTAVFGFAFTVFAASNIDTTEKYSQFLDVDLDSDTTDDLINWRPTNGGATVTDSAVTGNIWGETVGWINLNPGNGGVTNTCEGVLGGYAWGQNTGWINFSPTNAIIAPNINISTGEITGQVWAQNYGWIELASTEVGTTGLVTSWRPSDDCEDSPPPPVYPTITVKKMVVGGSAVPSNFTLSIKANGNDISGSPFYGSSNGSVKEVNLSVSRNYIVSEVAVPDYTATFSGDCNTSGVVTFPVGDDDITKLCTVTNTYKLNLVYGCKDSTATNYISDPNVIAKNTLCVYPGETVCKDPIALNYNPNQALTADNTKCNYPEEGDDYACKDPAATNYNPGTSFLENNSLCEYAEDSATACKDITALNYDADPDLQSDSSKCKYQDQNPDPDLDPNPKEPKDPNKFLSALKNGLGGKSPLWPMMLGIIGLASSIPGVIARAGHMLATFVWGRKKIRGIIYDSSNKEPLDPVYVSVIDLTTNQEIKNQLTDMEGRFGFVLPRGHYRITAGKTNYQFPSTRLAGRVSDEVYDRLYFGEPFTVENEEQVVSMNIPMDPVGTDWNQVQKHKTSFLQYLVRGQIKFAWLFNALFIIGFLASIMITYFYPTWWNYIMTALYVVLGLIQVYGHGPIHAGKVTKGGQPLAYGIVRVWSVDLNREVAKKVIESTGFYYILVPKADYFITIEQRNPDGTYLKLFTSSAFHARNGVISKSFDL